MDTLTQCRFCGGGNSTVQFPSEDVFGDSWEICKCQDCNAYFLYPFPEEAKLKRAYDASYYGKGKHKFVFSVEQFIDFFRKRKARCIASKLPDRARILDVGCGNGQFLKHLSSLGSYELYGTELEGGSAERARKIKEINLKIGHLTADDFPPDFFDAVTMFHVFEHLERPKQMLEMINSILKQNGILVMTFPNITGWQAKAFKGQWYHLDPPRHLVFFDPTDLIRILNGMGFQLISKKYLSLEQNPYGWVQSILNMMGQKREFLYEWLKGNKNYAPRNGRIRFVFSLAFFIFTFIPFVVFDLIESAFQKGATVRLEFRKK